LVLLQRLSSSQDSFFVPPQEPVASDVLDGFLKEGQKTHVMALFEGLPEMPCEFIIKAKIYLTKGGHSQPATRLFYFGLDKGVGIWYEMEAEAWSN
jgi:hypothetical protein